jgi:predicted dienelactone hydrolase
MRLFPLLLTCLLLAAPAHGAQRPVGVTTITFTKTSVTTGAPRVLDTVVWYPAKPRTGTAEALGQRDAAIRPGKYPLVIFSHGNCGEPTEATYFTMALARLGFIVAAPPHVGDLASDGTACFAAFGDSFLNRVPDVRFVLDGMLAQAGDRSSRFYRRIRSDKVAMSGLSFGGYTTLLAVQREPRFIAAFSLVPGGVEALDPGDISIPTLVIGAEHDAIVGFPESQKAYERLAGPRFLVEVLAANHLSSVDSCFNQQLNVSLCIPTDISQDDAHRLILHYALPFFRRYVRGVRSAGRVLVRPIPGVVLTSEPKRSTS